MFVTDVPYYVEALMSGHSWADALGEAVTVGYAFLTSELLSHDIHRDRPFRTLRAAE